MANANTPNGLIPIMRTLEGGEESIRVFPKDSGYAAGVFQYDAVTRQGTGYVDNDITPGTTYYLGVSLKYSAASTAADLPVVCSPSARFEAQMSAAAMASVADEGMNANLVLTSGVAATSLRSKHAVNSGTVATTNSLDVKILRKATEIDNEYGSYARVIIRFNKHLLGQGIAGV